MEIKHPTREEVIKELRETFLVNQEEIEDTMGLSPDWMTAQMISEELEKIGRKSEKRSKLSGKLSPPPQMPPWLEKLYENI